jgi:polysaccharide deacetylase family protein (PEP-CTERM system associated)
VTVVRHAFTVDLEEWFHGIELQPHEWPDGTRLDKGLDPLLELLDRHSVRATFFVLGEVAMRQSSVVHDIATAGHEIACHGHVHEFVYKQTPGEFRDDLARARDAIAHACSVVPTSYRAPYFSITEASRWALDILVEEGFTTDSSIFPVSNDRYGIPDAPMVPHTIDTAGGPLLEIPMRPLEIFGRRVPFSGGAYLRILPWWMQSMAWHIAERRRTPMIAYIHPWELDPEHPKIPLRRRVALTHYARLHLTERRLDRLLGSHEFGRLDELHV